MGRRDYQFDISVSHGASSTVSSNDKDHPEG